MTPDEFHSQLLKSTRAAVDFGTGYITNRVSSTISYDIEFNSNHDSDVGSEFSLYPENDGRIEVDIDASKVVELLCREGKVPAWIDISIVKSSASKTRMNLMCAGRFTDLLQDMYYVKKGTHPFGIKSPDLLPHLRHEEPPQKFRLYDKHSRMGRFMNFSRRKFTYYRWKLKQK
jgi:hypothetical protein